MLVNKILKVLLLLLGGLFVVLQAFAYEVEGAAISLLLLILLTVLYCRSTEIKSTYFFWFLIASTLGHLLGYSAYYGPQISESQIDFYYYGANILFIISYIFLIIRILRRLDFKKVCSGLCVPIIILVVLDVFCVSIVSSTTESILSVQENILEYVYNAVVMTLLSVALINYMYRNDNKSMLFLIASICIVFSEIIQLAYYYILLEDNNLGFIYSLLLIVAFIFFYLQSQLDFTGPEPEYTDEPLEV